MTTSNSPLHWTRHAQRSAATAVLPQERHPHDVAPGHQSAGHLVTADQPTRRAPRHGVNYSCPNAVRQCHRHQQRRRYGGHAPQGIFINPPSPFANTDFIATSSHNLDTSIEGSVIARPHGNMGAPSSQTNSHPQQQLYTCHVRSPLHTSYPLGERAPRHLRVVHP